MTLAQDGFTFTVDLAARTLSAAATDLPLDAGAFVSAAVKLNADRTLGVTLSLALGEKDAPGGRPVLAITYAPFAAELRSPRGGSGLPPRVATLPAFDAAGLEKLLVAIVPVQALWAGITFLRALQPGAVALVDAVLSVLGLLVGTGDAARVRVPLGLLTNPGHWLQGAVVLGDSGTGLDPSKLSDLLDAVAGIAGLPKPRPGAWTLPYGLELSADSIGGRAALSLKRVTPVAGTGLRSAGSGGSLRGERLATRPHR